MSASRPGFLRPPRRYFHLRIAALVVTLAAMLPAARAEAHAWVDRSDPAPGATVETAPTRVWVWFSEPVEPGDASLSVLDAQGAPVDLRGSARDSVNPRRFSVSLPAGLPDGVYSVKWNALTGDGGRTKGEFQFGVGEAVPAPPPKTTVSRAGVDAGIRIDEPANGAVVRGSDVSLAVSLRGVTLIAVGSEDAAPAGTLGGHLHVSLDGRMIGMVSTGRGLRLHGLGSVAHEIAVELAAPNHRPYDPPIEARTRIAVTGSSAAGAVALTVARTPPVATPPGRKKVGITALLPPMPATMGLLGVAVAILVAWALVSRRGATGGAGRGE